MGLRELFELGGKVALVTGGSRGLGLQIAKGLGEMGAKIAVSARKAHELEEAKADLKKHGIDALTVTNDLSKADQVPALVEAVVKHLRQDQYPGQQCRRDLGRARPRSIRWKHGTR